MTQPTGVLRIRQELVNVAPPGFPFPHFEPVPVIQEHFGIPRVQFGACGVSQFNNALGCATFDDNTINSQPFEFLTIPFVDIVLSELGETLSGRFFYNNAFDEMNLRGSGGVWTGTVGSDSTALQISQWSVTGRFLLQRDFVPEPGTLALLLGGLALIHFTFRRRREAQPCRRRMSS